MNAFFKQLFTFRDTTSNVTNNVQTDNTAVTNKTLVKTNEEPVFPPADGSVRTEEVKPAATENADAAPPTTEEAAKGSELVNLDELSSGDMTASMSAKIRINTEEEAKAALAERRRIAREEAERQAEMERQRIEEEARKELERQQREEEQQRMLIEQQRRAEQERLEEVCI